MVKKIYFYLAPCDGASRSFVEWARHIVREINDNDDIQRDANRACADYCDMMHELWIHGYDDRITARKMLYQQRQIPRYSYIKNLDCNGVKFDAVIDLLSGDVRFIEV